MNEPCCSTSLDAFDLPEIPSLPEKLPEAPQRHQRPTECSICGIPARGYHYDVPSCNGCKTFFRRTCISERSFQCKFTKDCYDLTIRKSPQKCRACRYQKCILVGMNPLALEVEQKDATAGNLNKLIKREIKQEELEVEEVGVEQKQMVRAIASMDNKMKGLVDMLTYLEGKLDQFRSSAYNPQWSEIPNLEYLLHTGSKISMADRLGPMQGWPLKMRFPPKPMMKGQGPMKPPPQTPDRKHWFFFNLVTSVEYAKTFMFFHELDARDKFLLARHVALSCSNLLISFYSYSKKQENIVHPDGTPQPSRTQESYNSSVMSVAPLIRYEVQKTEYLLLKAICLCNPAVPGLSYPSQEILIKHRKEYADALFDHCLRNRRDGPAHFAHLLSILDVLERQQKLQKDFHLLFISSMLKDCPKEFVIQIIEDIMDC